ncbi:hypothetical protein [Paracoccus denitrificans]|uniref:hypothetical protein n=2 Tax=Paracoccus denitrificans TaxID=266 RepID=UPI001F36BFA3|nr:hypothetical protein [Paracoccus denitrificans]
MLQVASSRSAVRPDQPFDHAAYDSGSETWAFSNDAPFEVDTVWLKNMPHYGYRRYDRMLARWQATQLIRPTPSAVDGYRIGQIDGRTAYTGQVLPANRAIWAETLLIQASIPATAGGHRNCDSGFR